MKKLFLIFAATVVLFACGNGSKKKALTVEEQAVAYFEQIEKATEAEDWEKVEAVIDESDKWYENLSEEDKVKADAAIEEFIYGDLEGEEWFEEDEEEVAVEDDWDEFLDEYEEIVDDYIRLSKSAMNGDMDALMELSELAEDVTGYAEDFEDAADQMTPAQAARFAKLSEKLAKAAM